MRHEEIDHMLDIKTVQEQPVVPYHFWGKNFTGVRIWTLILASVTSFYHFREKWSVCWRFSALSPLPEGVSERAMITWLQYNGTHGIISKFLVGWDLEESHCYHCILVFSPLASKFSKKARIWRNTSQTYRWTLDKSRCIIGKVWSSKKMAAALSVLFWFFVQLLSDSQSCQSRSTKPLTSQTLT